MYETDIATLLSNIIKTVTGKEVVDYNLCLLDVFDNVKDLLYIVTEIEKNISVSIYKIIEENKYDILTINNLSIKIMDFYKKVD